MGSNSYAFEYKDPSDAAHAYRAFSITIAITLFGKLLYGPWTFKDNPFDPADADTRGSSDTATSLGNDFWKNQILSGIKICLKIRTKATSKLLTAIANLLRRY